MKKIKVETSQNVVIEYELADLGNRIVAYLIDSLILGSYFFALYMLLIFMMAFGDIFDDLPQDIGITLLVFYMILWFFPLLFYHLVMEIWLNGQSIGKRQQNIKVIRLDGSEPTIGNYILRWLLRPIDVASFYGVVAMVTIAASEKGQRLGDMAAGTTVVRTKNKRQTLEEVLMDTLSETEEEFYQPQYFQVTLLNDNDINIIKETLSTFQRTHNQELINALATKVKQTLDIQSNEAVLPFLHRVVKDYNFLHNQG